MRAVAAASTPGLLFVRVESTVDDHLHYLNVFYSSKKSMRTWGRAVQLAAEAEGLVFGSGTAKHWHNTDPRMAAKRPGPLRIVLEMISRTR